MNKPFKQDWRYAQANREALLTLGAYGLYFVWWYACAYGLGDGGKTVRACERAHHSRV